MQRSQKIWLRWQTRSGVQIRGTLIFCIRDFPKRTVLASSSLLRQLFRLFVRQSQYSACLWALRSRLYLSLGPTSLHSQQDTRRLPVVPPTPATRPNFTMVNDLEQRRTAIDPEDLPHPVALKPRQMLEEREDVNILAPLVRCSKRE
jgi:hypothetical protein